MKTNVEISAETTASAEVLWDLISDISLPAQFSREFKGAEWITPAALGSQFVGHNAVGEFTWSTTSTVTGYTPNEVFEWTVEDVNEPVAIWGFRVVRGDVSTLTMYATIGDSFRERRYPTDAALAERMAMWEVNMRDTVDGIVALAEAAHS
ncbi:MAG: SRPBCC family protein [Actinomycetota bacterium]|jgi:hypothetical protein